MWRAAVRGLTALHPRYDTVGRPVLWPPHRTGVRQFEGV